MRVLLFLSRFSTYNSDSTFFLFFIQLLLDFSLNYDNRIFRFSKRSVRNPRNASLSKYRILTLTENPFSLLTPIENYGFKKRGEGRGKKLTSLRVRGVHKSMASMSLAETPEARCCNKPRGVIF